MASASAPTVAIRCAADFLKAWSMTASSVGGTGYFCPCPAWLIGTGSLVRISKRMLGQNGPSILLEILTKEPVPISQAGQGQKYPVPPTLDAVMLHAFKKSAAQRIATVGALADAIGQAYGLSGNHRDWANTS